MKHWQVDLEALVVTGDDVSDAITNALAHLAENAEQGIYPNVIAVKPTESVYWPLKEMVDPPGLEPGAKEL